MYQVFLLAVVINGALGQLAQNSSCGYTQGIILNITQFSGTWYQIERIVNPDQTGDCATSVYSTNWTVVDREITARQERIRRAQIVQNVSETSGRLAFIYEHRADYYYILTTDYQNYALLYTCHDVTNTTSAVRAWKMSRNTTMSANGNQAINAVIQQHPTLRNAPFRVTSHSADSCRSGTAGLTSSSLMAIAGLYLILHLRKVSL